MKKFVVSILFVLLSTHLYANNESIEKRTEKLRIVLDDARKKTTSEAELLKLEKLHLMVSHLEQIGCLLARNNNPRMRQLFAGLEEEIQSKAVRIPSWGHNEEGERLITDFQMEREKLEGRLVQISKAGVKKSVYVALNRSDAITKKRAKTIISLLELAGIEVFSLMKNKTGSIPCYLSQIDNRRCQADFVLMLLFPAQKDEEEYSRAASRFKREQGSLQTVFPVDMGGKVEEHHPEIAANNLKIFKLEYVQDTNPGVLDILTAMGVDIGSSEAVSESE